MDLVLTGVREDVDAVFLSCGVVLEVTSLGGAGFVSFGTSCSDVVDLSAADGRDLSGSADFGFFCHKL